MFRIFSGSLFMLRGITTIPVIPAAAVCKAVLAVFIIAATGGCASSRPNSDVTFSQERYTQAFDAARDTLREYKFTLERVDADEGIITTASLDSAGLAAPWQTHQTHLSQDAGDFLNHQQRRARVTFVPVTIDGVTQRVAQVEVYVDRLHSPGLRVPARASTLWSVSNDPVAASRGVTYLHSVPRERDTSLEKRIADRIERKLSSAGTPQT